MRRVTIVVIGNGKSTRANVEALISDVADSVDEVIVATVYDSKQSDGQVWADQWAQDKEIPILQYPDNNYDELFTESAVDELKFFLLWDDEDSDCQLAASMAQKVGIPAFDLTDGLVAIKLEGTTIQAPPAPPEHDVVEELPEIESLEEILVAEDVEYEEEDVEDLLDNAISATIKSLAELIAQKLLLEITIQLKTDNDD